MIKYLCNNRKKKEEQWYDKTSIESRNIYVYVYVFEQLEITIKYRYENKYRFISFETNKFLFIN